jgi:membrane-bound inhibitor of C-type lysozyme
MIRIALPLAALALASAAFAQEEASVETIASVPTAPPAASVALTLTLQSTTDVEQTSAVYQCDSGEILPVQYVNAAPNFLALVPVEGETHVFVTALSASGARYLSGPFEWWNTGDEATLRDLTQGEDAEPLATCTASSNTP